MRKFQFQLERVFRYHQQRLKQVELRLTQASLERTAAIGAVLGIQQQIDQSCRLDESAGTLINPAIRTNLTAHVEMLGKTLAKAKERLKAAEQRFREIEQSRSEVSQAVEGLSHLRDLRRQEHHDEVSRQQQIDLDEVVMRQWSSRDSDDSLLSTG